MNILIIAAGEIPAAVLVKKRAKECEILIAVDNGLEVFYNIGIMPDFIVGDMDSAKKSTIENPVYKDIKKYILPTHKNETDAQWAIDIALTYNPEKIFFLGALGKRIDHALSNIMLLKYTAEKGVCLIIEDEYQWMFATNKDTEIFGKKGQTVSIIPMNSFAKVTAQGLEYPLEELILTNKKPRGVSNVFLEEKAYISTKQWVLICFIK